MHLRPSLSLSGSVGLALAAVITSIAAGQNLSDRLQEVARQRQAAEASQSNSKAALLGALLYTDLSVDFKATPARQAFEYVATALGVPLVVRYNTDRAGEGIDPETEITLTTTNQPALTVIETMLQQVSVDEPSTWQLRDGFIEVGTKSRLSAPAARELRMYPVRDLLFEAPRFDNAPDFNLNSAIQQSNGTGGGGGGSGGGGGFGGGGGGGGFGGGGSGGGGGGGGGSIFGEPGDAPEMPSEDEKAQRLVDIIIESVEPDAWTENGGDWASIRYYSGVLIVRAPDWIHRELAGYPFAPKPRVETNVGRYVTFSAPLSIIDNVKFRDGRVTGAAGGSGFGGGGSGNGGGGNGGGGGGNPAPPATPSRPAPPAGGGSPPTAPPSK